MERTHRVYVADRTLQAGATVLHHTVAVDFDDNARLDTSQVSDVRGRRGGGGRGLAVGGGGLGIVGLLIALAFGIDLSQLTGGGGDAQDTGAVSTSDLAERCRTGADADRDEDCRVVGIVTSVQSYWATQVQGYEPAKTQLFSQATTTGCGSATSAVGPFYCPPDKGVYLDLTFFDVLRTDYGAQGGDFAVAYVIAHEYGHREQGGSVRLELQADCYAGAWAANAVKSGFVTISDSDIEEGLSAAAAVGDDRIQDKTSGRVDPESWTHGSAAQRQKWFRTGLSTGDPARCDTFAADRV